jgi:hypothetical protein
MWGASGATGYRKLRRRGSRGKAPIVSDHHMIEEGTQEAAIGAFLLAHEGHTQNVEIQRGAWTIYCRCKRCDDVHTYEVDNEARARAIGLPPWPELKKKMGEPRAGT